MTTTSPRPQEHTSNPTVILVIILSAVFMQLLDVSIVNVATPDIQRTLHSSYADVQLVLSGYQLGFASTLITAARLGDIFGRRRMFLIGMVAFTLASTFCGTAQSIHVLVLSRLLQGLSSALMFSQVLAVIQVSIPPQRRAGAFGAFGAAIGLGSIMGPLAGGLLIQAGLFSDPWRAVFLVNVPIGIAAIVAGLRFLPESTSPKKPLLDIPGVVLSSIGLGLIIYPLSEGRTRGWPAWILGMLGLGVVLLAAFAAYEAARTRALRDPVMDTVLVKERAFRIGAVLNLLFYAGIPSFFFSFNIYLQAGLGYSALGSGLATFPFALGAAVLSPRADKVAQRIGNKVLSLGAGLLSVGMLMTAATVHLMGVHPHGYDLIPAMLVCGIGFGLFVPPVIGMVLAGVDKQRAGAAGGLLSTVQQVGGATGVAVIGIVFFGLVGANASHAATGAQQALPVAAQQHFHDCFVTRAKAKDPTVVPPGCATPAGAPAAEVTAFTQAGTSATAHTFVRTVQESLLVQVLVFAAGALLVLRLPKVDPAQLAHGGPPTEA